MAGPRLHNARVRTRPNVSGGDPVAERFPAGGHCSGRGNTFYVGSIPTGDIFRGDVRTGEGAVLVDAPAGRSAIGLKYDTRSGLLFVAEGKTLYVVQSQLKQIAVLRLDSDLSARTIADMINSPLFDVPTTIARFGNALYAVNARFTTPPMPDTEYDVIRVSR